MGEILTTRSAPYDAEIEYLESTGTQFNHSWIDSGVVPDNATGLKFGIKDLQTAGLTDFNFIGCRNATTRFAVNYYNGVATYGFNSWSGNNTGIAFNVNLYHEISLNFMNTRKFTFDDHLVNITDTITDTNIPSIGLFQQTRNDTTGSGGYVQKLYFVKISRNFTIVRDFIPVRVGQTGYMYDRVSQTLFGNQGSGNFKLGKDIHWTKTLNTRIKNRYDTEENWLTENPILLSGETAFTDISGIHKCKVGDGETPYTGLPYVNNMDEAMIIRKWRD